MDVDNVDDDDEEGWEKTWQTITGKGPDGEDTLLVFQRRGTAMRVAQKGKGKNKRKTSWRKPTSQASTSTVDGDK